MMMLLFSSSVTLAGAMLVVYGSAHNNSASRVLFERGPNIPHRAVSGKAVVVPAAAQRTPDKTSVSQLQNQPHTVPKNITNIVTNEQATGYVKEWRKLQELSEEELRANNFGLVKSFFATHYDARLSKFLIANSFIGKAVLPRICFPKLALHASDAVYEARLKESLELVKWLHDTYNLMGMHGSAADCCSDTVIGQIDDSRVYCFAMLAIVESRRGIDIHFIMSFLQDHPDFATITGQFIHNYIVHKIPPLPLNELLNDQPAPYRLFDSTVCNIAKVVSLYRHDQLKMSPFSVESKREGLKTLLIFLLNSEMSDWNFIMLIMGRRVSCADLVELLVYNDRLYISKVNCERMSRWMPARLVRSVLAKTVERIRADYPLFYQKLTSDPQKYGMKLKDVFMGVHDVTVRARVLAMMVLRQERVSDAVALAEIQSELEREQFLEHLRILIRIPFASPKSIISVLSSDV
jgi:hypothetical protein